MSLTAALNVAQITLNQVEQKIAITSGNIANADREGYTRKVLQSNLVSNGTVSIPVGGRLVQAYVDPLLVKQVHAVSTAHSYQSTMADYITRYSQNYGGTEDEASTLASNFDNLTSSLQILESSPTDGSAKSKVVATAQMVTATLNQLSQAIQLSRLDASNEIATTIIVINSSLQKIADLNKQISVAQNNGGNPADLNDLRNNELLALSKQVGIQYFIDNNNQAQIYTTGGATLVNNGTCNQYSYTPPGGVSATTVYPGGFGPISLNGLDITTTTFTGKLGALIKLRDDTFPDEQAKLDEFANTMMNLINRSLNQGTAYAPVETITGTTVVTAATSLAGATGTLRVAVVDTTGFVQSFADINLASTATVGALVTALNGISGVSAAINSDGYLEVTSTNSAYGISTNPMTSDIGGMSATQYFGFNNLFTNTGAGATSITVNSNMIANTGALAVATLSASGTLASGQRGLSSGDTSTITALVDMLANTQSFAAAGNFGARTATIAGYIGSIISDSAIQSGSAQSSAEAFDTSFNYLYNTMMNNAGVNIDQETAALTILQTNYQASAQLIATVRELFSSLLQAVR